MHRSKLITRTFTARDHGPAGKITYRFSPLFSIFVLLLSLNPVFGGGANKKASRNFDVGVDISRDRNNPTRFFNAALMDSLGVDFAVYHYRGPLGTIEEETARLTELGRQFEEEGLKVLINVELGNWGDIIGKDGHNWVKQPDSLHLFKFPPEVLKKMNQSPAIWGIVYDELEHCQITRNLSISLRRPGVEPVTLAETTGMDFKSADKAVYEGAKSLVDECNVFGTQKVVTEHVWPVLYHNFARAGIIPAYKQMKENWSNVWAACAMGACLQYDRELWTCIDLWNHDTYPGHSSRELFGNLLFAYWAGIDKAYIESMRGLLERDHQGGTRLEERGKTFQSFVKEYLPANPRPYTFRDFEPSIAIIRFDDTEWGQGPGIFSTSESDGGSKVRKYPWKDWLFGAYDLNTSPESEEWIKAWHTITHGAVKRESLSWNAGNYYKYMPHRSFAPANAPVVFDDQVRGKFLETVDLAFLCGLFISDETLSDVCSLVQKNGLVVVTSARFAPKRFVEVYAGGTQQFEDGKGKWIITDDMAGDELKKMVKPFLGKEDEIVYRFKGNRKVVMKISADGNELDIQKSNM